ncbi:MAG: PilZ domain-containing protein [Burkholderiales bacterium]|nr:PilZ domain-containing protein [Burkholderiales bacterium]
MKPPDQRLSPRKPLRARGLLTLNGTQRLHVNTFDIAPGGMGISLGVQLQPGQRCNVDFAMFHNGKRYLLHAESKVCYCVCGGNDGFKAGLQFLEVDEDTVTTLTEFIK